MMIYESQEVGGEVLACNEVDHFLLDGIGRVLEFDADGRLSIFGYK